MGVDNLILQDKVVTVVIGGVPSEVGVLRGIGQSGPDTRRRLEAAARRWSVRPTPHAAIAFGYGEGGDARVIGWERGMGYTNDYDWSRLPLLGIARFQDDGLLALFANAQSNTPISREEAFIAGICDEAGRLLVHAVPRVATATSQHKLAWTHQNSSSLGDIVVMEEEVLLTLDDGTSETLPWTPELSDTARSEVKSGALSGVTVDEAFRWCMDHQRRDGIVEKSAVSTVGNGRLVLKAGSMEVKLQVVYEDQGPGRVAVSGGGGGAGSGQFPEDAFLDAGDRLAQAGQGVAIECLIAGYLAMAVGGDDGIGLMVLGAPDAGLTVLCGGRFPPSFDQNAASVQSFLDTDAFAKDRTSSWRSEMTYIPRDRIAPFLADFALYLEECSACAVRGGHNKVIPMFNQYLGINGIDYSADGFRPRLT